MFSVLQMRILIILKRLLSLIVRRWLPLLPRNWSTSPNKEVILYLMVTMFKRMRIWNKGKSVVIVIMMKLRLGNGTRIKTEGEGEGKNGNGQDEENEGGWRSKWDSIRRKRIGGHSNEEMDGRRIRTRVEEVDWGGNVMGMDESELETSLSVENKMTIGRRSWR